MKILAAVAIALLPIMAAAQNFAVLQAKDHPKPPAGIPADWPIQVQPIGDATNLPAPFAAPWQLMTRRQLDELKVANEAAKEAWNTAQETAEAQPKRGREDVIRQAIDDLKTIRDSNGTLTALQLSNAVRAIAKALVAVIEESRP